MELSAFGTVPARFDLITVDVMNPRSSAAELVKRGDFEIELDEDNGRWLVVTSTVDTRRFGLQRSDPREVEAREGGLSAVLDGCVTLRTHAPDRVAEFFRRAAGLSGTGRTLSLDDRPVIEIADGAATPSNIHLDLVCLRSEFESESDRLLELGATRVGPPRSAHWGDTQIFRDPGGGLFCLNAYTGD